jgi:hypothetical protein
MEEILLIDRAATCIGCGKLTKDWIWRQYENCECDVCFYNRLGLKNPKKETL